MPRGRPKLLIKDNFHVHEGYERWHHVDQTHSNISFHKSLEARHTQIIPESTLIEAKEQFEDYSDILNLLADIEKGIVNNEIIIELTTSIDILMKAGLSETQTPGRTKQVGVTDAPERRGPQTGRSLPKISTYETAPEEWEEHDDGFEGPPVNRRKNSAGEGNPGEDRGDYPIGDNDDEKREPNSIGIP